jgi:hypothetical protein
MGDFHNMLNAWNADGGPPITARQIIDIMNCIKAELTTPQRKILLLSFLENNPNGVEIILLLDPPTIVEPKLCADVQHIWESHIVGYDIPLMLTCSRPITRTLLTCVMLPWIAQSSPRPS